jgi:hypothetical protein
MDHTCTERLGLLVHRSRLSEHAIESPINIDSPFACMPQHTHKPILYRTAVEIFDDVKNPSSQLWDVRNWLLRPL